MSSRILSGYAVFSALIVFLGWAVWLSVHWIRSFRSPAIWVPATGKITKIHEVIRSSRTVLPNPVSILRPRNFAIYSGEYAVQGKVYSMRDIGSPDVRLGEQILLVYLERKPSIWRLRAHQLPGRETHWEIKVILGFVLVIAIGTFASVAVELHRQGYSWEEALRWYRAFTF